MTKYTLEEIEKAVLPDRGNWPAIKAALTHPKHNFREREVYWSDVTHQYHQSVGKQALPGDRPLRLSEMPQAVEDLRETMRKVRDQDYGAIHIDPHRIAREALAAFDELIKP